MVTDEHEHAMKVAKVIAKAMIGHNLTMEATALVAGKTLNAYDVWKAGSAALKDTRND